MATYLLTSMSLNSGDIVVNTVRMSGTEARFPWYTTSYDTRAATPAIVEPDT